jgi:hypothetical protein
VSGVGANHQHAWGILLDAGTRARLLRVSIHDHAFVKRTRECAAHGGIKRRFVERDELVCRRWHNGNRPRTRRFLLALVLQLDREKLTIVCRTCNYFVAGARPGQLRTVLVPRRNRLRDVLPPRRFARTDCGQVQRERFALLASSRHDERHGRRAPDICQAETETIKRKTRKRPPRGKASFIRRISHGVAHALERSDTRLL